MHDAEWLAVHLELDLDVHRASRLQLALDAERGREAEIDVVPAAAIVIKVLLGHEGRLVDLPAVAAVPVAAAACGCYEYS